jgi:hypothetical protein
MINNNEMNTLYGLKKGIVFYFYNDPYKPMVKEMISNFTEMVEPNYTSYAYMTANLKKINGNWFDKFTNLLEKSDFDKGITLLLTDATQDNLQSSLIYLSLNNIDDEVVCKIPNRIYFECSNDISWYEIYNFISHACISDTFHYISAGYNIGINDYNYPKSAAEGMKELRRNLITNNFFSTWNNYSLLKEIKNGIEGPNIIQMLNKDFMDKVGFSMINDANTKEEIDFQLGEDYIILNVISECINSDDELDTLEEELLGSELIYEKLKSLSHVLNKIILNYQKPQIFWKQNEWDQWINRFS